MSWGDGYGYDGGSLPDSLSIDGGYGISGVTGEHGYSGGDGSWSDYAAHEFGNELLSYFATEDGKNAGLPGYDSKGKYLGINPLTGKSFKDENDKNSYLLNQGLMNSIVKSSYSKPNNPPSVFTPNQQTSKTAANIISNFATQNSKDALHNSILGLANFGITAKGGNKDGWTASMNTALGDIALGKVGSSRNDGPQAEGGGQGSSNYNSSSFGIDLASGLVPSSKSIPAASVLGAANYNLNGNKTREVDMSKAATYKELYEDLGKGTIYDSLLGANTDKLGIIEPTGAPGWAWRNAKKYLGQ